MSEQTVGRITFGPWRDAGGIVVTDAPTIREQKPIATVATGTFAAAYDFDRIVAHGRLIAAAPDLLAALVMVRDADDDCRRDHLPTIPAIARATIDAAIAKAEGR